MGNAVIFRNELGEYRGRVYPGADYNAIVKLEERGSTDITDVTNEFFEEIERNED